MGGSFVNELGFGGGYQSSLGFGHFSLFFPRFSFILFLFSISEKTHVVLVCYTLFKLLRNSFSSFLDECVMNLRYFPVSKCLEMTIVVSLHAYSY